MTTALRRAVSRLARTPVLEPAALWLRRRTFPGTAAYWERRYAAGGTSGAGSSGPRAAWKAEVVNGWVRELGATSVVDLFSTLADVAGLDAKPEFAPARLGELQRSVLDISRARDLLGWTPEMTLREGLAASWRNAVQPTP